MIQVIFIRNLDGSLNELQFFFSCQKLESWNDSMRGNLNHPEEEQQERNLVLHSYERRKQIQCLVDFGKAWWKTKMKKSAENNEEDED